MEEKAKDNGKAQMEANVELGEIWDATKQDVDAEADGSSTDTSKKESKEEKHADEHSVDIEDVFEEDDEENEGGDTLGDLQTAEVGFASISKQIILLRRRKQRYHARANTERFLLLTDDVSVEEPRAEDLQKSTVAKCSLLLVVVLALGGSGAVMAAMIGWVSGVVYCTLFAAIGSALVYLDHTNQFHAVQTVFEKGQKPFIVGFCVCAFIDYILISLREDNTIKGQISFIISEAFYYLALALFFCTVMAFWKVVSFHCNEKSWTHALFYLSVIGGALLTIARWLRPPEQYRSAHWHRRHELRKVLSSVTYILILLFSLCVILGGIFITAFAEFARWTSQFGAMVALGSFGAMSMCIMLTPLAPGSIVDACGGFVFIIVLVEEENWSMFSAWITAIVCICVLHYCGACAQWYIGTMRFCQIWGNTNLPVEMLAASDAVLREANWFEVGLIGYLFMDTANGLNQGRVNMEFWTQLLSEWPAWPNALGLVSLGAVIGIAALGLEGYDWTADMVPLLILTSSLIQTVGVTFGTHAMGSSVDGVKYWTAREKWEMMHLCRDRGYTPTEEGWRNDCFNLSSNKEKMHKDFSSVLFDRVAPIHKKYIEERDATKAQATRIAIWVQYNEELDRVKKEHFFERFQEFADAGVEKGWLVYEEPVESRLGYFDVEAGEQLPVWKENLWIALVCLMVACFWVAYYYIYWRTDLSESVEKGLSILNKVPMQGWVATAAFVLIVTFIYHIEMWAALKSSYSTLKFALFGCSINPLVETRFETPVWILPPDLIPVSKAKKLKSKSKVKSTSAVVPASDTSAELR